MQIAQAEMIAVGIITIAYFALIPTYGITGAAWATVIGFAARFYWTHKKGKQSYDMKLPWGKVSAIALLAMITFSLSLLVPEDIILSVLLRSALVIFFILAFFALPIFSKDEKEEVIQKTISLIRRKPGAAKD